MKGRTGIAAPLLLLAGNAMALLFATGLMGPTRK
jgi:hypothetical protein